MITVIPNFVPVSFQEQLKRFVQSSDFPLYRDPGTAVEDIRTVQESYSVRLDRRTREHPQLVHSFVSYGRIVSNLWPQVAPIYFELSKHLGDCEILRCKLNVNTQDRRFSFNDHYLAHYDVDDPDVVTAIYYVESSDGPTYFYDQNMEVIDLQMPEQGTLVYFPAQTLHSGSPPRNSQMRTLINFNVKVNKTNGAQ